MIAEPIVEFIDELNLLENFISALIDNIVVSNGLLLVSEFGVRERGELANYRFKPTAAEYPDDTRV